MRTKVRATARMTLLIPPWVNPALAAGASVEGGETEVVLGASELSAEVEVPEVAELVWSVVVACP